MNYSSANAPKGGNPAIKHVGIWVRVSTEEQAEGDSPAHHERRARAYAESKNWHVAEVYHLEGVSGKSVIRHPETERMMADVAEGRVTGLIFSKLARLARNTRELLDFADFFQEHSADLVSLGEAIDTSSPAGRLFYTMIGAMAQWEREEISARVAASVPIRAKMGKPLGGAAPFGYRWHGRELIPDLAEAPIRKHLYELFLQHGRKKTVARLLNDAGHRTRNGSRFTDTTVDRLLRDPTAKGVRRANYTKSLGEGKHWKLKPESEWVLIACESVVPEDVWERANMMLDANRAGRKPARKTVHLFSGVIFCECGGKMYVPTESQKYTCYSCRNKLPVLDMEEIFREQLKGFFFSADEMLDYLASADETIQNKEELAAALSLERRKLQAEMDKLYHLYLDDRISGAGFGAKNKPLEARLSEIDRELPDLEGEIDFLKIQLVSSDEIFTRARDVYARWQDLTPDEKRAIVEQTVERVTVGAGGAGDVAIELGYLPSSSEIAAKRQRNFTDSSPPRA